MYDMIQELETFERELPGLLVQHEGKHVLIHGADVAGVYPTFEAALIDGYARFSLQPFIIQPIEPPEKVLIYLGGVILT